MEYFTNYNLNSDYRISIDPIRDNIIVNDYGVFVANRSQKEYEDYLFKLQQLYAFPNPTKDYNQIMWNYIKKEGPLLKINEENMNEQELNKPKEPITISITGILEDLSKGLTRFKGKEESELYDPEIGSIEEKWGLTKTQVTEIFKHPALKGKRTISQKPTYTLVDDRSEEEKAKSAKDVFGKPSESMVKELEKNTESNSNTVDPNTKVDPQVSEEKLDVPF